MEKPIEPIHEPEMAKKVSEAHTLLRTAPKKIEQLNETQQKTSFLIARTMRELPGIETRPQITKSLDEIVKSKGEAIQGAKAVVSDKEQIYSLEITMKEKPVILTVSIDDAKNSTTIVLTEKSGKMIEGFYNQSKMA